MSPSWRGGLLPRALTQQPWVLGFIRGVQDLPRPGILCLPHWQRVFTTEPPGTSPRAEPIWRTPQPHPVPQLLSGYSPAVPPPPERAPVGEPWTVGSPTARKGLGLPSQDITVSGSPPSARRSWPLREGCAGQGLDGRPGEGKAQGPAGQEGGASHRPLPRGLSGARHSRGDPIEGRTGCGT